MSKHLAGLRNRRRDRRLFEDDAFKDITFKLQDGEERAHRCVLSAEGEVFKLQDHFSLDVNASDIYCIKPPPQQTRAASQGYKRRCVDIGDTLISVMRASAGTT